MKINLGCGKKKIHGFVNVDIDPKVEPDVLWDIANLNERFQDVDLIYACHVLEHFGRSRVVEILKNWYEVLRDGGVLRISVPNFESICSYYLVNRDLEALMGLLYGGQKNDLDHHFCCHDYRLLTDKLMDAGFETVRQYDWRNTDHFYVDDYSQSYLPHMDKNNGMLMSLNVEAVK